MTFLKKGKQKDPRWKKIKQTTAPVRTNNIVSGFLPMLFSQHRKHQRLPTVTRERFYFGDQINVHEAPNLEEKRPCFQRAASNPTPGEARALPTQLKPVNTKLSLFSQIDISG